MSEGHVEVDRELVKQVREGCFEIDWKVVK